MGRARIIRVFLRSAAARQGIATCGPMTFACVIGRSGLKAVKREGDGATPMGRFRLVGVLWRADRGPRPAAPCPVRAISGSLGWCDAPGDRNYNRSVRLPYGASAERMWREDDLYDVVAVLDYNLRPRSKGRGSAIFLHAARPAPTPTEGCIALPIAGLRRVLAALGRGAMLDTLPGRQRPTKRSPK